MKQAKAVYDFNARSENEISFAAGDLIFIIEEDQSSGWSKGRTKDYKEGYFPQNYVEIEDLEDSDSDEDEKDKKPLLQCIAIYDFSALSDTQISFKKGDIINITKKGKENDWWEGKVGNKTQTGLFPSNYVQLSSSNNGTTQNDSNNNISTSTSSVNSQAQVQSSTSIKENTPSHQQEQHKSFNEPVNPAQQHKLDGKRSDLNISGLSGVDSPSNGSGISSSSSSKSVPIHSHLGPVQNTSMGYTPPNSMSPLAIATSFDETNPNYKDFATLSPISPALASYSFSSTDNARKRLSMHIPSSTPLSLSLGGENTRDFDALCLLYPYLPSSVSQQNVPGMPPGMPPSMFTPEKHPNLAGQSALASAIPPSLMNFTRPQSAPQALSHLLHQSSPPQPSPLAQSPLPSHNSPHLTPQQQVSHQVPQQPAAVSQPVLQSSPSTTLASASITAGPISASFTTKSPSTATSKPAATTTSSSSSASPSTTKDRYSNRDRNNSGNASANTSSSLSPNTSTSSSPKVQVRTAASSSSSRYSTAKSPGRRDASSASNGTGKRKPKLEGSLVLGKKHIATISHTNTENLTAPDGQLSPDPTIVPPELQQLTEVEYLKKVLQQEVELRAHLESVVHDAHGKLNAASHYIKDLKAELFQSNMDISQLRVTNRQLNEQLDKYQLVTRVTVATQTERDENIDKIRMLTEQIHDLETTTEELNEQIATLKSKNIERSPRSPRSPRALYEPERSVEVRRIPSEGVDYNAVKQQFARVRACLLLEKEEKTRLLAEKTLAEEKLHKTEQHSKNIKRKLLSELQLKSDLNVRNQHIEIQMLKLKEELAAYKQR